MAVAKGAPLSREPCTPSGPATPPRTSAPPHVLPPPRALHAPFYPTTPVESPAECVFPFPQPLPARCLPPPAPRCGEGTPSVQPARAPHERTRWVSTRAWRRAHGHLAELLTATVELKLHRSVQREGALRFGEAPHLQRIPHGHPLSPNLVESVVPVSASRRATTHDNGQAWGSSGGAYVTAVGLPGSYFAIKAAAAS